MSNRPNPDSAPPSAAVTGNTDPRVVGAATIHTGKKFDFLSLTVRRPSGRTLTREIVRHPGAIVVVPLLQPEHDGEQARIVLIRNFRITLEQKLLECCAGTIERSRRTDGGFVPEHEGEDPRLCAARELEEETGYSAARLHPLGWFYTTPGLTDEKMHAFVATGLTHVGQRLEEDETIEVVSVPISEALAMVCDGGIRDAKSMLALMLAEQQGWLK